MVAVVGVRFKSVGKVYYFDPAHHPMDLGTKVVVETARGLEYGDVCIPPRDVAETDVVQPLKPVLRIGSEDDARQSQDNKRRERDAFATCLEKIDAHGLDMNLVDVEYTFDAAKAIFYFTAEGRVDFRDLVKDLASSLRCRIEMRQIGVRDEAKLIGGIGPCGRILCCTSFLAEFQPVSIRMAKDQNLSLNPTKISGVCGRLMCCLRYEQDQYQEAKKAGKVPAGLTVPVAAAEVAEPALLDALDEAVGTEAVTIERPGPISPPRATGGGRVPLGPGVSGVLPAAPSLGEPGLADVPGVAGDGGEAKPGRRRRRRKPKRPLADGPAGGPRPAGATTTEPGAGGPAAPTGRPTPKPPPFRSGPARPPDAGNDARGAAGPGAAGPGANGPGVAAPGTDADGPTGSMRSSRRHRRRGRRGPPPADGPAGDTTT